jgi:hypothetical protein
VWRCGARQFLRAMTHWRSAYALQAGTHSPHEGHAPISDPNERDVGSHRPTPPIPPVWVNGARMNILATARSTATRDYECSTGAAAHSSRLLPTRSRSPHDPEKEWSAALLKRLHEAPQLRQHADKSAALDGLSLTSRISDAIDVARAEAAGFGVDWRAGEVAQRGIGVTNAAAATERFGRLMGRASSRRGVRSAQGTEMVLPSARLSASVVQFGRLIGNSMRATTLT